MLGLINIKLTIESAQAIADNMKKLKTLELFESESDEHAVQLTDEMALIIARGLPQLTFFSLSTHPFEHRQQGTIGRDDEVAQGTASSGGL